MFLSLTFCIFSSNLASQPAHLSYSRSALDVFFGNVDTSIATCPTGSSKLFYDLSGHVVQSRFFEMDLNDLDTSYSEQWYKMYDEVRYMHMGADTNMLDIADSVYVSANRKYGGDTIPLGIMDYEHYRLKENVLNSEDYFLFDTDNNTISDNTNRESSPYLCPFPRLFVVAPLRDNPKFGNVTFAIDPQFVFSNIGVPPNYYEGMTIRINFGDGSGYHTFSGDMSSTEFEEIQYNETGDNIMEIELLQGSTVIAATKSKISIRNLDPSPVPDDEFEFNDLRVSKFGSCESENPSRSIIYVEGIDILDDIPGLNRTAESIYDEMIKDNRLANLHNFGYNYYVVDWKNSKKSLYDNSLALVEFINFLKCEVDNDHQFVVVGESMGGLIAREALAFMETEDYTENWSRTEPCDPELLHKTRLFISLDAPHQGANVPLAYQLIYRHVANSPVGNLLGAAGRIAGMHFNKYLNMPASQQMLIYHLDYTDQDGNQTSSPAHQYWLDNKRMPNYCKTMAIANGNLSGENQWSFNREQFRQANDLLFQSTVDVFQRVLWIRFNTLNSNLTLRTNPNGSGQVFTGELDIFRPVIDISLFSVVINQFPVLSFTGNFWVQGVKPFGVSAGGRSPALDTEFFTGDDIDAFIFASTGEQINDECSGMESHIGIDGFFSVNLEVEACSHGFHFGFIPTASALDLDLFPSVSADYDYRGEYVSTNKLDQLLDATPFSVIQATPNDNFDQVLNRNHVNIRNDNVDSPLDYPNNDILFTCMEEGQGDGGDGNPEFHNYHLNKEIGDQEMWINNYNLNHNASFQSEIAMYANVHNPYYNYHNFTPNQSITPGPSIYSKKEDFDILNGAIPTFIYDAGHPQSELEVNLSSSYDVMRLPLGVCCIDQSAKRSIEIQAVQPGDEVSVYPNPVHDGQQLWVKASFAEEQAVNLRLTDMQGRLQRNEDFYYSGGIKYRPLSLEGLPKGVYLIDVIGEHNAYNYKIIVK